jgi:EmrB/QacA subfamily drug resistance transporter
VPVNVFVAAGTAARGSRRGALGAVLGVLFLTFLDTTIVSVTLGDMETDIAAGVIPLQWVINAYALSFASLMLVGGSLGDRFGRRRLMVVGIVVFCAGSLLCALSGGVTTIIVGRAIMGAGAAAAEPGTLSVIRQLYPERRERARALGAWSAISGLALAVGPVLGGLLVGAGDWRTVFWFNLALGLLLLAVVVQFVPESRDPQPGRLDLAGFLLATAGIGCVVYAAIAGEYQGFGDVAIIALFVVGVACLLAFGPVESRAPNPMLDLDYVRPPIVRAALFAGFAVYFGVFAIFFLTALYLDVGLHYSGEKLAGMFAPMAAAIVLGGLAAGPWVARSGSRPPLATGCIVAAVGMLLASIVVGDGADLNFWFMALALALAGLGFGTTVVPLTSAVLSHVPSRHSGVAASITNTARQLGAVVGVAVLGAVVNVHLKDGVSAYLAGNPLGAFLKAGIIDILETGGTIGGFGLNDIPAPFVAAFVDGLQVALIIGAMLTALAALVAVLVREPPPLVDDDDTDEDELARI